MDKICLSELIKKIKNKTNKNISKYTRKYFGDILILIILSICLSVSGFFLAYVFSFQVIKHFSASPMLFLLNVLPLTISMLVLYFLTARVWASYLLVGGIFLLFQFINRLKTRIRHEPFVPADLFLGSELTRIFEFSELAVDKCLPILVILFLFITSSLLLYVFCKSKKMNLLFRISSAIFFILACIVSYNTLYRNTDLFNSFKVIGSTYSTIDVVKSRGLTYSFIIKSHFITKEKPEGYSVEYAKKLLEKYINNPSLPVSSNDEKKYEHSEKNATCFCNNE